MISMNGFARLKLVLRVEKKMHVIEQPLPPAPEHVAEPNVVDQWTALYDAHTEIAFVEEKDSKLALAVLQLTPPYTPQHNGVSKRRNRTLLDMVRSMMNLTTLPLSFWDYALESATRILNMVPTKKVDKTPYELWYGKVPNLSYLKVWGCEALVKRDTPDKLEQKDLFRCMLSSLRNVSKLRISERAVVDLEESREGRYYNILISLSKLPQEVEGFEPLQEEVILIRRS
ncbi:retrotransposon protein, putative, ty1-copia subclass [Tanacetum coccineum]